MTLRTALFALLLSFLAGPASAREITILDGVVVGVVDAIRNMFALVRLFLLLLLLLLF